MSVDMYAYCPCGNGKKIKFCRCRDSVHELERVKKMIEGGQFVPALDRLAKVLQEHPGAAWALAIRGKLLLDLHEVESLRENSERFIRLQPNNPLALAQRAAAMLAAGEIEPAIRSLLESLAESGRGVDTFVLHVASLVSALQLQTGGVLASQIYGSLVASAEDFEPGPQLSEYLDAALRSANVNRLLKAVPSPVPRPEDVEWSERFDEAYRLLKGFHVLSAQSKFESLRRVTGGHPSVLSCLLLCAIWRADVDAQADYLKQLSACESLDWEARCRYRGMSLLVAEGQPEISIPTVEFTLAVDDLEPIELAFTADSRFEAVPRASAERLFGDDQTPPRAVFQWIDRDQPETVTSHEDFPESLAVVALHGRETDREPRVRFLTMSEADADRLREAIGRTLGEESVAKLEQTPGEPQSLVAAIFPRLVVRPSPEDPIRWLRMIREAEQARIADRVGSLSVPLFGRRSLRQVSGDAELRSERDAFLLVIRHDDRVSAIAESVVPEIYRLAGAEFPPPRTPTDDELQALRVFDLDLVDPEKLSPDARLALLSRAAYLHVTPAVRRLARAVLDSSYSEQQVAVHLYAYDAAIAVSGNAAEMLEWHTQAMAYAEQHQAVDEQLLLRDLDLRIRVFDGAGMQASLQRLTREYGNDPEVMAMLQQLLISRGILSPDGSAPRQMSPGSGAGAAALAGAAAPASEPAGSGLWTPDSPATPSAAPDQGGSKLWVPGMD